MHTIPKFIALLAFLYTTADVTAQDRQWSYEDTSQWGVDNEECNGTQQSPIALNTSNAVIGNHIYLSYNGYGRSAPAVLTNNGHTVSLQYNYSSLDTTPYIRYTSRETGSVNYYLESLHFHWGSNNSVGSEHTINNARYPLELHMIHRRRANENTNSRELLVAGMVFRLCSTMNAGMRQIYSYLGNVMSYNSNTGINSATPRDILYRPFMSHCHAFVYNGSLTTPPCNETVQWVVYQSPLCVSQSMLDRLRSLRNSTNGALVDNFRPLQEVNDRQVSYIYEWFCRFP